MSTVVAYNLHTNGNELKKLDGKVYRGSYHILDTGTIMSGVGPNSTLPVPEVLLPIDFMEFNSNNELVSEINTDTNSYEGLYSVITVKTYKNDVEIVGSDTLSTATEPGPPTITLHPDQFFRRDSALSYDPGREIFVDPNRNVVVATGSLVPLSINFISSDDINNVTFEWIDSYDRVVTNSRDFTIDTNTVNWSEETFYCTITDSYGSESSNEVTISIIDPFNHPIILNNILKNGSGNEDTAEWQTIGGSPEEIGKFLPKFEISKDLNGMGTDLGTIHYHKIDFVTGSSVGGSTYKNQWYPRPEAIDYYNGLTVSREIEDNYFRAGQFTPVTSTQNDHAGTTKSSFQTVDLTEYANLLSGKVYGIKGFRAVLFGWLGGRADQGDYCRVEFKFLDENDEEIFIDPDAYKNKIESLRVWDRVINNARTEPDGTEHPSGVYQLGYNDIDFDFNYLGLFYDGNDAINLNSMQGETTIVSQTGIVEESFSDALCKTIIVGRMSDMIGLQQKVRKIKVIKYYAHEPGKHDLVNGAKAFKELGEDYISDAMVVGLNLRLYPIIIDAGGNTVDLGIDTVTGLPAVRGFNMDDLQANQGPNYLDDVSMQLDTVEWLNRDTTIAGRLFEARTGENDFKLPSNVPGEPVTYPIVSTSNNPAERPLAIGTGYTVTPNAIMFELYRSTLTPYANKIQHAIGQYKFINYYLYGQNQTIYRFDELGLLNYGGTNLWVDFDDDNVFM